MDEIANNISEKAKDCGFSLRSVQQFLILMSNQRKEYTDFVYKANGSSSLLLKAEKNRTEIALKVIECKCYELEINAIKSRNALLKQLAYQSDYFVKVNEEFYLEQNNDTSVEGQISNVGQDVANTGYFVTEMELCLGSLSNILEEFRLEKRNPTERCKMYIAIQILDSMNLLHQRQIALQQGIDIEKILISSESNYSQLILKFSNVGLTSRKDLENNQYSQEAIEQNMFQIGLVFLQLDNYALFNPAKITVSDLTELRKGKIFENLRLNRKSLLYKIGCKFLIKSQKEKVTARSMLLLALQESKKLQTMPLFSVVLRSNLDQISMQIIQMQATNQQNNLRRNRETRLNTLLNELDASTQQQKNYLTKEQLKSALETVLEWRDFAGQYDLLGVGKSGVFLGVENIKENRQSVLRLSLCLNKSEILKQIGIMRICQSPYIVKFYGQQFFKDSQGNEFVVQELERCKYSLYHYLELHRNKKQLTDKQKDLLMLQILDSVGFLHENKILHRNISLSSFMITENQQGQVIAKLSNFSYADSYRECCIEQVVLEASFNDRQQLYSPYNCLIQPFKGESVLCFAPERLNNLSLTTYQTDRFAVGICLTLLDNYLLLNEDQLNDKLSSFLLPYQDIFKDTRIIVNSSTNVYHIASKLLKFNPQQRKPIQNLIQECLQCYSQNIADSASFSNSLEKYPKKNINQNITDISTAEFLESLKTNSPFSFPLQLSFLSLDFQEKSIGDDQTNSLLSSLIKLTNLTNIVLNFNNNQISDLGAQFLLLPLANLKNLSSLSLNLSSNLIGQIGEFSLLSPLTNLINISNLIFDFQNNQIGNLEAQTLLSPLVNLLNLSSLSLNLENNQIRDDGAQNLLLPIRNLTNLTNFTCNLTNNQFGEAGAQFLLQPLKNLINLLNLSLNYNKSIKHEGIENILLPVTNLINLSSMSFRLSYFQLNKFQLNHLFLPLAQLCNLSTLIINLRCNFINDNGASSLLIPLTNLPNISSFYLDLDQNQIGEMSGSSLLSPLSNFKNLSYLSVNLSFNSLQDMGSRYFLNPLTMLTSLSSLEIGLSYNKIGTDGIESLLFPLRNLINLKTISLDLQNNLIEGSRLTKSLLSPLVNLSNLSTLALILNRNPLGDIGVSSLLAPLTNLKSLTKIQISLDNNSFGTISTQSLFSPLVNLTGLLDLQLNVSNNKIGNIGAEHLLSPIVNLTNLSRFSLSIVNSQIDSLGAYSLLIQLTNLKNLSNLSLDVSHNSLGDIGAQYIWGFLSCLPQLSAISCDLKNNQLEDFGSQTLLFPVLNLANLTEISINLKENQYMSKKIAHIYKKYLQNIKITFLE